MFSFSQRFISFLTASGSPGGRFFLRGGLILSLFAPQAAIADALIAPQRLIQVADITGPVVSPDGTKVAFRTEQASIARNTYDTVWYVQEMDGKSPPVRVGEGGVPKRLQSGVVIPATAIWSPDGRWIYYRALADGKDDIWRARTDGFGANPITHDPANIRQYFLSPDGNTLYYSTGATRAEIASAEQAEYYRGIHVDATTPVGYGGLFRSGYVEGRLATQRLKYWYDRVPLLDDVPDHWHSIDLIGGQRRDLAASDLPSREMANQKDLPEAWRTALDTSNDRTALLVRTGDRGDLVQKPDVEMEVRFGGNAERFVKCVAELCSNKAIWDVHWRPRSDELLYTVSDESWAESIYAWNVKTDQIRLIVGSSGLLNDGERYGIKDNGCGLSSVALVCVTASATEPPRLERIDLDTGDRRVLFDPNPSLRHDMATTIAHRAMRWRSASGQLFTGQFFSTRKQGSPPSPLFITYYRCPGFLRGGYGGDWPLATLASFGISTLCINHAPLGYNAVNRYNLGLSAVKSAVDMLASTSEIDRKRIGMGGLSFGTEITMWTAFRSNLLKAASITSTMWSSSMYLDGTMQGKKFDETLFKVWQLGALKDTKKQWEKIGLQYNLDKVNAPVLMQMPEQEYGWMLDSSIPLIEARKADLYVFPNSPHFKFQPKQVLAANQRNVDWFRFWLQGYEDPDPAKAEQYEIWKGMRDPNDHK